MKQKRIFCILLSFFVFNFSSPDSAYSFGADNVRCLKNNLKTYFLDYYSEVEGNEFIPYQKVLADIKDIVVKNGITGSKADERFQKIDDFLQLTQWFNQQVEGYDLGVNIFINPQSKVINCWLAEAVSTGKYSKKIWGKKYAYKLVVMDRLFLHDYPYFAKEGKDELDIVVAEDVIFCNKEVLTKKVKERWSLLLRRYYKKGIHAYNPSKSDRLRKRLLYLAWEDLFLRVMGKNDPDKAKELFFKEAEEKLFEVAVFHELGHMMADEEFSNGEDAEISEIIALLTELRFGPLPHETLNTLLSFAWKSPWNVYRYAGQYIIRDFIQKIEGGFLGNNSAVGVRLIRQNKNSLVEKQDLLYYLSSEEIRSLTKEAFRKIQINQGRKFLWRE